MSSVKRGKEGRSEQRVDQMVEGCGRLALVLDLVCSWRGQNKPCNEGLLAPMRTVAMISGTPVIRQLIGNCTK
jgi:hypothetical protein